MSSDKTDNPAFSEKEMQTIAFAWQCIDGGEPKVDYKKLASLTGYTEGSASVTWRKIARKLKSAAEANGLNAGNDSNNAAGTPAKSSPRKRKGKSEDATGSPTKKPRARGGKSAVTKVELGGDEAAVNESDDVDVKGESQETV